MNNTIIFSRNIKTYFEYLKTIFRLFAKFKITFKLKKFYFRYSLITLLE